MLIVAKILFALDTYDMIPTKVMMFVAKHMDASYTTSYS